jgi:phage terminase Nu1 subunit (DNA packaging protein)
MQLTYSQLAEILDVSTKTIRNKLGASTLEPIDQGPGKSKLWPAKDALRLFFEIDIQSSGFQMVKNDSNASPDDIDYNFERARTEKGRADKLELDNAKRSGLLLDAESVKIEWAKIVGQIKTKITSIPFKIGALVEDLDERRRIYNEAKKITDAALNDLATEISADD